MADRCRWQARPGHRRRRARPSVVADGRRRRPGSNHPRMPCRRPIASAPAVPGRDADALGPEVAPRYAYTDVRHLVSAATAHARWPTSTTTSTGWPASRAPVAGTTVQPAWRKSVDTVRIRDPFPLGGVAEDPATGTAMAAFGRGVRSLDLVPPAAVLAPHQGADMSRPGTMTMDLRAGDSRVRVGAGVPIPVRRRVGRTARGAAAFDGPGGVPVAAPAGRLMPPVRPRARSTARR